MVTMLLPCRLYALRRASLKWGVSVSGRQKAPKPHLPAPVQKAGVSCFISALLSTFCRTCPLKDLNTGNE